MLTIMPSRHVPDLLQKEVSAVLVIGPRTRPGGNYARLPTWLRECRRKGVNPVLVMRRLMENLVGNVRLALMFLTALIILVSGIGIFVSIYNSMADRQARDRHHAGTGSQPADRLLRDPVRVDPALCRGRARWPD